MALNFCPDKWSLHSSPQFHCHTTLTYLVQFLDTEQDRSITLAKMKQNSQYLWLHSADKLQIQKYKKQNMG